MVFMNQVHGVEALQLDAASPQGQRADAVTTQRGLACTVMVADCLPVLLTTQDGAVVAAAHAGAGAGWRVPYSQQWRRRSESFYASFSALAQAERAQSAIKSIAWLGPCIGPSAFEVGEEVKTAFMASQFAAAQFFVPTVPGNRPANGLARLPASARRCAGLWQRRQRALVYGRQFKVLFSPAR